MASAHHTVESILSELVAGPADAPWRNLVNRCKILSLTKASQDVRNLTFKKEGI